MTRMEQLGPCSACGGSLFPLVVCESCGAATIFREAEQLDRAAACPKCGTSNPWQLICDQCHSRFPAAGVEVESPESKRESAAAPHGRPRRRIKGEFDTGPLLDLLRVVGVDPSRAQALIDRGYDALWKIARASEEELARIPEVGPVAARKMVASFHLLNYSPPQATKELVAQEEYACPLCACITSAFASACLECGATFDEEEMDEAIRREFAEEGDAALLTFFDRRLAEKPDDPDLLYSRGLLLEALGRVDEAIDALDRAATTAPDARRIKVALLRIQARELRKPNVAEKLRTTASSLLDDVAWDQEVAQLDHLISEAGPSCPECGTAIPKDAAACPSCGHRLVGAPAGPPPEPARSSAAPELDTLVDDLLVGELEQSLTPEELELTKAAVLDWLIMELEETMAADAQLGAPPEKRGEAQAPSESSPVPTSAGFLSGWMRGSRGLVSGLRPKPGARGAGKVNGLVNGRGRVNGLVNGVGRVNGLVQTAGRVNGLAGEQGRINGLVNGTRFVRSGKGVRFPSPSKRVRYAAIASGTLVAILIVGFLFVPISGPPTPIVIDGSFGDWASVPMFDAATVASVADVSIARYASLLDSDSLYLFAATRGATFGDPIGYDGIYFLIDGDGDPSTGFSFDGIGADTVAEVFGGNQTVEGARLYSFPSGAELNWSQRQPGGAAQAAASGPGLEARVSTYDIDRFDPSRFRVSVYADDFRGSSSRSKAFLTAANGAVLLQTRPLTSVVGSGPTSLFEIQVQALGIGASDVWGVSAFSIVATPGVIVSLSAESVNLTQGQPNAVITASVSAPGFFPGDVVRADLAGATGSKPVFIRAESVRAYVIAPPSTVRIDGLFADWVSRDVPDTDPQPGDNSALDIRQSGAATSNATAFFHVRVAGSLLMGGLPERIARSPPGVGNGSSGGAILPRRTGEDLLFVYVDANASDSQGLPIGGILADWLVEIRGEGGNISSKTLYSWSNRWIRQAGAPIIAEKNTTDIEASLPLGSLSNARMVFETTDWSAMADRTASIGAPSFVPSPQLGVGVRSIESPQANGFDGSTLYLRDAGPSITPPDCSAVKGLSTSQGSSGQSLTLSSASRPCFFTDPEASPETIPPGIWSAALDLSTSAGTVLNITFAVTQEDGSSASLICATETSTGGGPNRLFSCSGGEVSIGTNQRIRLRIEYVSGSPIDLAYDGSGMSEDGSITIPAPEFGDIAAPSAAAAMLILLISYRRRRRAS